MATKDIAPLKETSNAAILDAIRADSSLDYQRRIPEATKAGVQETVKQLTNHRTMYNEFLDALVNRIGSVIARNISWTNPLAEFKRGMLQYGDTIEEIQVGLLQAHTYDPDREYMEKAIFGTERPDVQANFHRVNRQDYYKVSVNEALLQRAFLEAGGLSTFVSQLMEAPSTSDQWDEFLLTCQLFAEYESNGGFYHVNVPDVSRIESNEDDAKLALRKMRGLGDPLKFPSTKYNAAKMPSFASQDELVLFVTPEFNAAIDVEALAGAFNVDRASMHGRVIPIPKENFAIEGAQAIMTVRDFFVIADQRLENTSQWNPVALQSNYFLHHWQVISASRFVPAVMFHTGSDDEVIHITPAVTGVTALTVKNAKDETVTDVERGKLYQVEGAATLDGDGVNDGVRWSVTNPTSPRTYITQTGVLHVAGDEGAATLEVTATSTWLNPSNLREDGKTAKVTVTVVGDAVPEWPEFGELATVTIGDVEIAVVDGQTDYTFEYVGKVTKKDVAVTTKDSADVDVAVDGTGRIVTVGVDGGEGDRVVYTFTATDPVG